MAAGWVPMLCGLAVTSVAGGVSVGSDPAPGGWTLDIVNAGGDVVLVANVDHGDDQRWRRGRGHHAVNGGPAGDEWRLFTERSGLDVLVLVEPDDVGTTAVSITPIGTAAGDVSEVSISFDARDEERFFGLGERADEVEHRGSSVVNRVSDGPWTVNQLDVVRQVLPAAGFSDRRDATYFPMPWVLSTNGYGVLVDNHETSRFDLATEDDPERWTIDVSGPNVRLRVFTGAIPPTRSAR